MKVEVTKKLIADDGKSFRIGEDIGFDYENIRYIVEIADIGEKSFTGRKIVKNKADIEGVMLFEFDKVSNCSYVYYD